MTRTTFRYSPGLARACSHTDQWHLLSATSRSGSTGWQVTFLMKLVQHFPIHDMVSARHIVIQECPFECYLPFHSVLPSLRRPRRVALQETNRLQRPQSIAREREFHNASARSTSGGGNQALFVLCGTDIGSENDTTVLTPFQHIPFG
jgi:hypothetical protein